MFGVACMYAAASFVASEGLKGVSVKRGRTLSCTRGECLKRQRQPELISCPIPSVPSAPPLVCSCAGPIQQNTPAIAKLCAAVAVTVGWPLCESAVAGVSCCLLLVGCELISQVGL